MLVLGHAVEPRDQVVLRLDPHRTGQRRGVHPAGEHAGAGQGERVEQLVGDAPGSRLSWRRTSVSRSPDSRVGASSRATRPGGAVSRSGTRLRPTPRVQTSQRWAARQLGPCTWMVSRSGPATRQAHGRNRRGTGRPPSATSPSSYGALLRAGPARHDQGPGQPGHHDDGKKGS